MTDKPRLIDADKLLKWLNGKIEVNSEPYNDYRIERAIAYEDLKGEVESCSFDPDPLQQPNIQPGDRVVSISKPGLGTGVVVDLVKENLDKFTDRTWVRFGNDEHAMHTRTSDLQLIQNEGEEV
ncbi:hypothetical protein [Paenibacillus brasilensis]|uniref:Phage protein n=1 Tax=Paenibacillus brasilensis TaxID=128574 RepID=A0ABU0KX69_9BACL|nr:hypothetical protein [Paenibacillus brasilensis]MDQ0494045.1 hypothetical protein [Paenibacillus brasilensis]